LLGPTWGDGPFGSGLVFDGVNDRVRVSDADTLDASTAVTVAAWIKLAEYHTWAVILLKESSTVDHSYALWIDPLHRLSANFVLSDGTRAAFTTGEFPLDAWTHVAATYDGSMLRLYVNGAQVAANAASGTFPNTTGPLWIGGDQWAGDYFPGSIDEVRVYDRALTAPEIVASMEPAETTVRITSPFPGTTFNAPSTLLVSASATGGAISRVDFYDGASFIGSDAASPYEVTWVSPSEGEHLLTAVAIDQSSNSTTSTEVLVYIDSVGPTLGRLGAPIATPPGGLFPSAIQVELRAAPGATIHYTLDGAAPNLSSPTYSGALTIAEPTLVQAIAVQAGWSDSEITVVGYEIDTTGPTVLLTTPVEGTQNVGIGSSIGVSFDEVLAPTSVTSAAIELRDSTGIVVPAPILFDERTGLWELRPSQPLNLSTTYSVVVRGGADPLAATDLVGNRVAPYSWTFTTQSTVQPPTFTMPTELHVRNSSEITIVAETDDPQSLPLMYTWTQLAGPTVVIRSGSSPIPSVVTPDETSILRFRGTASNGFFDASAEVDVYVRSENTSISAAEGHTSDLVAIAPALQHGYLLGRAVNSLSIDLASPLGTILQPTEDLPFTVMLETDSGMQDVTGLFDYSSTTNSVSIADSSLTTLRDSLDPGGATLIVSSPDSAGGYASFTASLVRALARVEGTVLNVENQQSLAGGLVTLVDTAGGFRASAVVSAGGTFAIDDVPAGSYDVALVTDNGFTGGNSVTIDENLTSETVTVDIEARSLAGPEPKNWPCDPNYPFNFFGSTAECTLESVLVIPRGTPRLSVKVAGAVSSAIDHIPPAELCAYGLDQHFRVDHGRHTVRVYLDGQLVVSKSRDNCNFSVNGAYGDQEVLADLMLSVGHATRDKDAVVRVVTTRLIDYSPEYIELGHHAVSGATWAVVQPVTEPPFSITKVTDRIGSAALVLGLVCTNYLLGPQPCPRPIGPLEQFVGVPTANVETLKPWRLRINYSPADATVTEVRAFVEGQGVRDELTFASPILSVAGEVTLNNVRFPASARGLLQTKPARVKIVVEVTGIAAGQSTQMMRAELGLGDLTGAPSQLTALYDAGRLPGALRYSPTNPVDRQEGGAQDGWGTRGANDLLAANPSIRFNDLSWEHGGDHTQHDYHATGRSIDTRYFGNGGESNLLNGVPGQDFTGLYRLNVLTQASAGDVGAQREIVAWILQNRSFMDQLFANPSVERIRIGGAEVRNRWNVASLRDGRYPNGALIRDPDRLDPANPTQNLWIGAWSPSGILHPSNGHLSHAHIELRPGR
jgi:hypothetical protein